MHSAPDSESLHSTLEGRGCASATVASANSANAAVHVIRNRWLVDKNDPRLMWCAGSGALLGSIADARRLLRSWARRLCVVDLPDRHASRQPVSV